MDKEQAINVLTQALNVATEKGAFNLNDISHILNALQVIKE
jgi:hypothetical protein